MTLLHSPNEFKSRQMIKKNTRRVCTTVLGVTVIYASHVGEVAGWQKVKRPCGKVTLGRLSYWLTDCLAPRTNLPQTSVVRGLCKH